MNDINRLVGSRVLQTAPVRSSPLQSVQKKFRDPCRALPEKGPCAPYVPGEPTELALKAASLYVGCEAMEAFRGPFGTAERCRAVPARLRLPDGFVCPAWGPSRTLRVEPAGASGPACHFRRALEATRPVPPPRSPATRSAGVGLLVELLQSGTACRTAGPGPAARSTSGWRNVPMTCIGISRSRSKRSIPIPGMRAAS